MFARPTQKVRSRWAPTKADAAEFIRGAADMKVTPHVAQNKSNRKSAVPDEIAGTEGYAISMQSASSSSRVLAGPSSSARSAR